MGAVCVYVLDLNASRGGAIRLVDKKALCDDRMPETCAARRRDARDLEGATPRPATPS